MGVVRLHHNDTRVTNRVTVFSSECSPTTYKSCNSVRSYFQFSNTEPSVAGLAKMDSFRCVRQMPPGIFLRKFSINKRSEMGIQYEVELIHLIFCLPGLPVLCGTMTCS